MRILTKLLCVPLVFALYGCGTYRMKGIDQSNESQVATLNASSASPAVFVHSIDGEAIGFGLQNNFQLLPGRRVLTILGNTQMMLYASPTNVVVNVVPKRRYQMVLRQVPRTPEWSVEIVDIQTNERADSHQSPANCTRSLAGNLSCTAN